MMKTFDVCIEHIIVVPKILWCPMNYYWDGELNYRDDELNYGYAINFIPYPNLNHIILLILRIYNIDIRVESTR
jgi:hypothetical protein